MGRDPTIAAPRGISGTFLALIAAQAAHSVEEYLGKLYEVFPPARFVSGLVSGDLRAASSLPTAS